MTVFGKQVEISLGNILFATDFSPSAEKAGLYARAIAKQYSSTIWVIHIIDLSATAQMPDAGVCIDALRKSSEDDLGKAEAQLVSAKIRVKAALEEGFDPASEILEIAKKKSVDLIVSGTRGQKGLARLALGSVAEQLIHHATCPVLTIGPEVAGPETPGSFQRIVYATDFSAEAAKAAPFAFSFAQDSGAHVYLCHVLPGLDRRHEAGSQEQTENFIAALQRLVPATTREWCEPECTVEHGFAADGILLLAHRVQADLIVLGTRRFSHWFDSFKAGIAYEVIRAAPCPVLTVRG